MRGNIAKFRMKRQARRLPARLRPHPARCHAAQLLGTRRDGAGGSCGQDRKNLAPVHSAPYRGSPQCSAGTTLIDFIGRELG
jgi:hypothetical protein